MIEKTVVKVLVPAGALGIPYDRDALARGLTHKPDLIAIDGGSTDSGPFYLGTGTSKYSRSSTKSDWGELMAARAKIGVPLLIGTAGTCGTNSTVDWLVDITKEIASERHETLTIAVLKSDQSAANINGSAALGRMHPLEGAPAITSEIIEDCTNIVALAGAEQIQQALATGADIIIAGRTTDTAIIAALPLVRGCHKGAAWHGAKIAECGALATTNPNSGVILMEFDQTGFTIIPMSDNASATPQTVSAHMLYENSDPFILYEPGGYLDVTDAHYHSVAERSVRVEGSQWHDTTPYCVKVEGARISGYQTVSFVLVRDSGYVSHIDQWVSGLETVFASKMYDNGNNDVALEMRIIGKNATLGALETDMASTPELGIMAIFTAPTQAKANEAAKILNPHLLHMPLTEDEPMPTFAFPFSPAETDRGPLYEFCLHHVCELETPMAWFSLDVIEVKADG
jgi:hypothetical protein